jgi:hypothetical protein
MTSENSSTQCMHHRDMISFCEDTLTFVLREELSDTDGDLLRELARFLMVRLLENDRKGDNLFPSSDVGKAWRAFILFTSKYDAIMRTVAHLTPGTTMTTVHHFPERERDPAPAKDARRVATIRAYAKHFSEMPPRRFWSENYAALDALESSTDAKAKCSDPCISMCSDAAPSESKTGPPDMQIVVRAKCVSQGIDSRLVLNVNPTTTIEQTKQMVFENIGIPPDQMRLVFAGKALEGARTLQVCGVGPMSTLVMLMRLSGC